MELTSAFDSASTETTSIVDAEQAMSSTSAPAYHEVLEMAETLSSKTKDLRVLAIYAESCWRGQGLPAFAVAMEDLVSVAETWPDPDGGVHPRADEEDGDLGERSAPIGRLLNRIPTLANTIGWGDREDDPQRAEARSGLKDIFDRWDERLGPALGEALPPKGDAWRTLSKILGGGEGAPEAAEAQAEGAPGTPHPTANAWDTITRAAELMARQDHHSPALPMLRLLATWRDREIIDISKTMRESGISLEQLFDSIDHQLNPPQ